MARRSPSRSRRRKARGHEILLQIPMRNATGGAPGPHALRPDEPATALRDDLAWLTSRFDGYDGVTNLLGAPVTDDETVMTALLRDVGKRGLFYVDDGLSRRETGLSVAAGLGVATLRADLVLDATADPRRDRRQSADAGGDRQAQGIRDRHGERLARPYGGHRPVRRRPRGAGDRPRLPGRSHRAERGRGTRRGGESVTKMSSQEISHYRPCVGIMLLNTAGWCSSGNGGPNARRTLSAAAISGRCRKGASIRRGPYDAAVRELTEETNVTSVEKTRRGAGLVQLRPACRRDEKGMARALPGAAAEMVCPAVHR